MIAFWKKNAIYTRAAVCYMATGVWSQCDDSSMASVAKLYERER